MYRRMTCLCLIAVLFAGSANAFAAEKDFVSIFDGKTLKGWDGNPELWSVEDGAITGKTNKDKPLKSNSFIIWRDGETKDFILKLDYKIVKGNSGIQYRSFEVDEPKWTIGGYQADFEAGKTYSGILYGERFRGILGLRGQKTIIGKDHKPKVVGSVGDSDHIQSHIKHEDWNSYTIIAKGNHFVHKINGITTVDVTDEDIEKRRSSGLLALQIHVGPPMVVQFKNIRIKHLDLKKKVTP